MAGVCSAGAVAAVRPVSSRVVLRGGSSRAGGGKLLNGLGKSWVALPARFRKRGGAVGGVRAEAASEDAATGAATTTTTEKADAVKEVIFDSTSLPENFCIIEGASRNQVRDFADMGRVGTFCIPYLISITLLRPRAPHSPCVSGALSPSFTLFVAVPKHLGRLAAAAKANINPPGGRRRWLVSPSAAEIQNPSAWLIIGCNRRGRRPGRRRAAGALPRRRRRLFKTHVQTFN
jgi:hypothetical protein